MTPKEEALKLVSEFDMLMPSSEYVDNYEIAKQCALIAVDEIINCFREEQMTLSKWWWQEVKQEIEKL